MNNPYMFVIKAVPMSENKDCEGIAGASVHVWVIANDKESAKARALDYIESYLWEVTSFEHELEIEQERILMFHEDEILLYMKAREHGIAADFVCHPKKPGKSGDPAVIRKLERP